MPAARSGSRHGLDDDYAPVAQAAATIFTDCTVNARGKVSLLDAAGVAAPDVPVGTAAAFA